MARTKGSTLEAGLKVMPRTKLVTTKTKMTTKSSDKVVDARITYWKVLALQRHDALQQMNRGMLRLQAKIDRVRKDAGLRENKLIRALNEEKQLRGRSLQDEPLTFRTNDPAEALRFVERIFSMASGPTKVDIGKAVHRG